MSYKPDLEQLKDYLIYDGGECLFFIENSEKHSECWMGRIDGKKEPYWFGLTPDGSEAYDFATHEELINAKVFDGNSLAELIDKLNVVEIWGFDPKYYFEEIIPYRKTHRDNK